MGLLFCTLAANAISGFSLLTPARLWDLARIGQLSVSPDGEHVVFTVATYPRSSSSPAIDLWLVRSDGKGEPHQLTRNPGPDFDPAWSADSSRLVYVSARASESADLLLLNLRGGEPEPLPSFPTDVRMPRFRPGHDTILFAAETYSDINADREALNLRLAAEERVNRAAVSIDTRVARRAGRAIPTQRVVHLFEIGLDGQGLRDLTPGFEKSVPLAPFEWDVSPDGRLLAYTGLADEAPFVRRDRDIFIYDIEAQQGFNLTGSRPGSAFEPQFTQQGQLIFGETPTPDALAQNTRLVSYDLRAKTFRTITDPAVHSPDYWHPDPSGQHLYYQSEERGRRHTFRIGIGGGKGRRMVEGGDTTNLDIGPEGNLYYLRSDLTTPPVLYRADPNGKHPEPLTRFNQPLLEDTRLGEMEEVEFPGYREQPVQAFLIRPPGFRPERRWPVLVLLHGGPHAAWLERFYFRWNLMTFAAPGYLVLAVNPHGSTGFGQDFAATVVGDPLAPAAADVSGAVRYLLDADLADPDRLVLVGGSYGGYLTHWIMTRDQRFATGIVHAGIFDVMLQYASDYPWGRHRTYGALPWESPDRYRALSPSSHSAAIQTPLLLLHGERDTRVPVAHSLLAHNILTARGVPTRIVLFPDQGHAIESRLAAERWWEEIGLWLEQYAPPGPR
ncbi:MAG: S9 family peptidase [Xanthomonadales bacterium]|nr:S9 family peptidase [Xanthomonadales bacterium]